MLGGVQPGGVEWGRGGEGVKGGWGQGTGDISVQLPCTALPHGASPKKDFAQ